MEHWGVLGLESARLLQDLVWKVERLLEGQVWKAESPLSWNKPGVACEGVGHPSNEVVWNGYGNWKVQSQGARLGLSLEAEGGGEEEEEEGREGERRERMLWWLVLSIPPNYSTQHTPSVIKCRCLVETGGIGSLPSASNIEVINGRWNACYCHCCCHYHGLPIFRFIFSCSLRMVQLWDSSSYDSLFERLSTVFCV